MNDETNNKMDKRFSGVIGEDYDCTFRPICPHLDQLEASVSDAIQPLFDKSSGSNPLRVLDLGCGDGLTAKPILERFENVFLTALDCEQQMLSQFEINLAGYRSKFETIYQDAFSYLSSLPDASFDAIVSCFVLHNWKEEYRLQILKELFRVIRPGGIFVNADKIAEPRPRHDQVFLKQLTLVIDTYSKLNRYDLLREWVVHYLEDNIQGVLWFESEAIKQLSLFGFEDIRKTFRYDLEATLVARKPF